MPTPMRALLLVVLAVACSSSHPRRSPAMPPVLTDPAQLDAHVGQVVTLRGVVSRTKVPTLLGVDVDDSELADQPAEATGRLEREVVTQQQIDDQIAESGQL